MFSFTISSRDPSSSARTGVFETPHGAISTPVFMPCGTKGAVKTVSPQELQDLGCEILLGNTFHLMLKPGAELIAAMGGLHSWTTWHRPILTDSGGFQVFSLARLRKISAEGVEFRSPADGSLHFLTPEKSIAIQEQLGADIVMAFDECPPGNAAENEVAAATERTHTWLLRCQKAKKRPDQALFPIVQGGIFPHLRRASAQFVTQTKAEGYAIGGVAVGEPKAFLKEVLQTVCPILPENKPRYLMGVGEPLDILEAVSRGVDMFDCVLPTRLARHGSFWSALGRKHIKNREFLTDEKPLQKGCLCPACSRFSRSYLRHLMMEGEILGHRLLSLHNLHFLFDLMRRIRAAIEAARLADFKREFEAAWKEGDHV